MGSEWRRVRVEDIKSSAPSALATGPFGSAIGSRFFQDSGVPVLRGSNLSEDVGTRLVEEDLAFLSPAKAAEFRRSVARRGDLVFTCWGTIGQVGLIDDRSHFPEYIVSNKQMKLTPDPDKADSQFLYYLFSSPEMVAYVRSAGIGSSVPGFNLGQLRQMPILLPPLAEQRRIAGILGALDDKIELNRQTSQTLESMARALFKSWFVDFDPVRTKAEGFDTGLPRDVADLFPASLEESELGERPIGWRVATLGDIATSPRRPIRPDDIDPATPYIGLEHMPRRNLALAEWGRAASVQSGKTGFRKGEILFGKLRPYFHKVGVAPVDGVCSTDIVVVAPKDDAWFGFVLGHVSSDEFVDYTNATSSGTKMPRTSWSDMARFPLVEPPAALAAAFTAQIGPSVDRMILSIHEMRTLAAVRDLLLPSLMTGQVSPGQSDSHRRGSNA